MSIKALAISPHPPILIPQIGRGEEYRAKSTLEGMEKMARFVADVKPEVILIISPHGNMFADGVCILDEELLGGDFSDFGYEGYRLKKRVNSSIVQAIKASTEKSGDPCIFMDREKASYYGTKAYLDHGALVPLYFIEKYWKDYQIVHITPGQMSLKSTYKFGMTLRKAIDETKIETLILASGDLSHCLKDSGPYSFAKEGPIFDQILVESIRENRYMDIVKMQKHIYQPAGQCGLRSIVMALGAADKMVTDPEVYSYEGPFGVGYMTAGIEIKGESDHSIWSELTESLSVDEYVALAKKTVEQWVLNGNKLDWNEYRKGIRNKDFIETIDNRRAGAFVSIHSDGNLRGCIGTIKPTEVTLAREIINNAVEACAFDPRFNSVEPWELEKLEIKVDILGAPEEIKGKEELDVKKYGVIVEKGNRRGLLLPDLEGVDTVDHQIEIAKRKAGIPLEEDCKLYRFTVERHG
ncbi:AmmeMemoRadiSam system protein A [Alkalibacter mobilis]|uniref:AmmeMemoRadiSam system protein A n=1 Tax=Alkalibacter mobilis TaxID=2787712 RepID=UPI0018A125C5|nr:AmmeMemoRadiSam system protein A [Alkalibacter mobilis]MBF7096682.1 AmmeMemoRadiSam system protein A [Alkalibacter mobilis]